MYELIIRRATIADGTGAAEFSGDAAVAGGRFVAVAPRVEGEAAQVIDADGLVLAPGFIDIHCHSDRYHIEHPDGGIKLRQGVTLEVVGNCGASLAPLAAERAREAVDHAVGGPGRFTGAVDWLGYGQYADKVASGRPVVNAMGLVGHGTLRIAAMGFAARPATAVELARMERLLDEAMSEGAAGMSSGLYYAPGLFASTEEVVALARVVARRGGYYATHLRNEAEGLLESLDEAIHIGRASGVPVHVSHLKAAGRRNWHLADAAVARIEAARDAGLDVTVDVYPYHFSSTSLLTVIPPWALDGGIPALLARLSDPATRARIVGHMQDGLPGWENIYHNAGWEKIILSACATAEGRRLEGRSVADVARDAGRDPFECALDLIARENGSVSIIAGSMNEENVARFIALPYAMIGSDGAPNEGKPHPRVYGTFPRVVRRFVRELKALRLAEAVHKMTGMTAARLGLSARGRIAAGAVADAVVFDPQRFADTATFDDPRRHPVGVRAVLVAGRLVLDGEAATGERPGTFVRAGAVG
ncbi:MAG: D-aminoacylase [Desulfobacterales bacterium]|jgi:N-acyl-D-aspartate/D-glutamate deacylase|nr:D-aminoacylase [Desulfobacterales bacterium]